MSLDDKLLEAAKRGNLDEVKRLIEKGADINTKDKDGKTPLYEAAYRGHLDVVKYLVEKGADVKMQKTNTAQRLYTGRLLGAISTWSSFWLRGGRT